MGNDLIKYSIPIHSLKEGVHELTYSIEQRFIEENKIEGVLDANLELVAVYTKQTHLHSMVFTISGELQVECDRCLDAYELPIQISQDVLIRVAESNDRFEENEEVLTVNAQENEINFTHLVYEAIMLAIPIKKVHPEGYCNEDMLQYISQEEIDNNEDSDSTWDSLKNIFDN